MNGIVLFVRKDFVNFLESLSFNDKLKEINITTNGALISNYIDRLEKTKIKSVNLSIDSLNREKFFQITRRDVFDKVKQTYKDLLTSDMRLKLNVVVQSGFNTNEIIDFVELTKNEDVSVRFIEEMPFNGKGIRKVDELWDFTKILDHIRSDYKSIQPLESDPSSTSGNFKIESYKGSFGIIPAYTRSICSDCNRIRITATGMFKNCLFDDGVFNLKDFKTIYNIC